MSSLANGLRASLRPERDHRATSGFSLMANYLATAHLGLSKSHWPFQSWNDIPDHTPDLIYLLLTFPPHDYSKEITKAG